MGQIATENKILILSIILGGLLSYTIYSKFFVKKKEGASIIKKIGKIFKIFSMIMDFFCWMGEAVKWMGSTVASLFYYVGNVFTGCILFYIWDCIVGTCWFIGFLFASMFGQSKSYLKGSNQLSKLRNRFDKFAYNGTGIHVLKYSDVTSNKCYKMKFKPFPKWPF